MPFRTFQKTCFKKEKFLTKLVIVDKQYRSLIIFKSYDDMLKYVSGLQNYQYYYQTQLTSSFTIDEVNKIIYKKLFVANLKENKKKCILVIYF